MKRRTFLTLAGSSLAASTFSAKANLAPKQAAFEQSRLLYPMNGLAPHIQEATMQVHYGKHHASYTAKLNEAIAKAKGMPEQKIEDLLKNLAQITDADLQLTLRNQGGGFYNHELFWSVMAPEGKGGEADAKLLAAIDSDLGGMASFQSAFEAAALKQFGSGWAWLVVQNGKLKVVSTANQDCPLMAGIVEESSQGIPILGLDVWEHAYYLDYQNRRADYIKSFWKIVNWQEVSRRYSFTMENAAERG